MKARLLCVVALSAQAVLTGQSREVVLAADLGTHLDPIARFDGSAWRAIPPASTRRVALGDWARWPVGGSSRVPLQVAEPAGRCASPRKLPVRSPASTAASLDSGYVGIAATGAVDVQAVRRVIATSSPEWSALVATIGPIFERRAQQHGVTPALLGRVKMSVDWVSATTSGDGQDTYYFEASKRIPDAGGTPAEDPRGEVRVVVSGWLRHMAGQFVAAGSKSELFWGPEGAPQRPSLLPLGVLRQGDTRIWVMAGRTGARDVFTLYSLRDSSARALLTADAAAC